MRACAKTPSANTRNAAIAAHRISVVMTLRFSKSPVAGQIRVPCRCRPAFAWILTRNGPGATLRDAGTPLRNRERVEHVGEPGGHADGRVDRGEPEEHTGV